MFGASIEHLNVNVSIRFTITDFVTMNLSTWISLLMLVPAAHPYPSYRDRIPNGRRVPDPCRPLVDGAGAAAGGGGGGAAVWDAPGHRAPLGGGARNRFGEDFAAAGHVSSSA